MDNVRAKVTFEYTATQEDELTLVLGDIVTNIDQQDGGWWEGEIHGKRGLFPENFVEVIKEPQLPGRPKPSLPKAKVIFDYQASEEDELDLKEGDIVEIFDQEEEGWWHGISNGKKGMFPSNFVEFIKAAPPEEQYTMSPVLSKETDKIIGSSEQMPLIEIDGEKSSNRPPSQTEEGEPKKSSKPSSGMGFAISSADLFKTKLRPVSMVDDSKKAAPKTEEPKKPIQTVTPLGKPDALDPVSRKRDPPDGGPMKRNAPLPPKEEPQVKASGERYRVTFDYQPENTDELELKKDDIVMVTDKDVCEGWWEGACNGKTGVFPNNFVEPCPAAQEETTKQLPRKPLVPPASKAPALPARETKDESKDVPEPTPLPVGKKPPLIEQEKPMLPETNKPALPEHKKPDFKKPPPPAAKSKPVPPRPTGKPHGDENASGDSFKNKLNATFGSGMARLSSIGKKPPPQPNGFARTSSQSIKRPVPVPVPEQKPAPVTEHKPVPVPVPEQKTVPAPVPEQKPVANKPVKEETHDDTIDKKKEDSEFEWDQPATTQVLSNVNKNRVKGPGKALPAKYNQNKEQPNGVAEQPSWKKDVAQKKKEKPEDHLVSKEKKLSKEQSKPTQPFEDKKPSTEKPSVAASNDDAINEMKKIMELKMGNIEKKLMKHIEVLTNDLDEERKLRASLQIEVDRLKKQVSILQGSS